MAYTVADILNAYYANLFEGTSTESDDTLLAWIDEAQQAIAREYGQVVSQSFPGVTANVEIALPNDYLVTATVKRDGEEEPYLKYFITEYGFIYFEDDGDYEVYYHRVPDPMPRNDPTAVPEVHHSFHSIIHLYMLHKFFSKEPESGFGEAQWAETYRIRFYEALSTAVRNLKGRARTTRKIRRV